MDKTAINPKRLQWCLDTFNISLEDLSKEKSISLDTLKKALDNESALTIKQLEKLAKHFKRSLLFFVNPTNINETDIFSPQFRTLNNQQPINSPQIITLLQRVEKQREIFISLLEDMDIPISTDWKNNINTTNQSVEQIAKQFRKCLNLNEKLDFNTLREKCENQGIMVIVTNGYNGKWQISKKSTIVGFSLYYDTLPIIVIKKQFSKPRQSFTLLHELAHLLLHRTSMIDNDEDLYAYIGNEKEANEFAGRVLVPDECLAEIDVNKLLQLDVKQYDAYLNPFKNKWSSSAHAIIVRLLISKQIPQDRYNQYKAFKEKPPPEEPPKKGSRFYRYKEPKNIFGDAYVKTVFDALSNKHITLYKTSTYLDNLKISDVKTLQSEMYDI